MNARIEDIVSKCPDCQENRREQLKEPMMPSEIPTRPWQIVAADLLQCLNRDFIVVIDYYSDFIEVEELKENTHSATTIEALAKMFALHGKPDKLITDNGPQFRSHLFAKFTEDWDIKHITTSPYHHQANGKVERANQTVRHLITKTQGDVTKFYNAMLQLRNTPTPNGSSPVQRLMSRRTATKLPTATMLLQPQVVKSQEIKRNIQNKQQEYGKYFNRHTKPLQPLNPGDTI